MNKEEKIKKITNLVKAKIEKNHSSFKNAGILDWAKKFIPKIPSKQEAEKYLKNISNKEVEEAFKFFDKNKTKEKMSFDLKKTVMILVSLAVLNGGVMPSDASAACSLYECAPSTVNMAKYIGTIYTKEVKNLDKAKSFEEAKQILLEHAKTDGIEDMKSDELAKKNINNLEIFEDFKLTKKLNNLEKLKILKEVYLK